MSRSAFTRAGASRCSVTGMSSTCRTASTLSSCGPSVLPTTAISLPWIDADSEGELGMNRLHMLAALLAVCPVSLLGCGTAGGPSISTVEVHGRVTLRGRPVHRVTLSFTPVESGKGQQDV